ncbi:HEAT repeat domain-containing protein [Reichenbachiella carrageenanivorans]|uniref:HEAT repeat domain-containing protein n=1 Tax=Reichenbachiella carrageenanivorans TaxID=2979869 RepID=A0ABY6D2P2_9BACT|nr:HEAT repeat domain-containing protein [Reichenbachiella carrageenanivorans]UXX80421.1 HEAT repeat domain-containing protein [Reichenbachiella carrageenanivorans]
MAVTELVAQISGELDSKAYEVSDTLARIGTEEVVEEMIKLLSHENSDSKFLAARTLGKIKNNEAGLAPLLEAIQNKENSVIAGDLFMMLEDFDLSSKYVEIFKHFLNGSFKVSTQAKDLLDHKEFDITPRVIRKAKKHWEHYSNNVKQDELYDLRKIEVNEMLEDLEAYLKEE